VTSKLNGALGGTLGEAIARVIEAFDGIVQPDGGHVSFAGWDGRRLHVAYAAGSNADCPTCVMAPEALAQMMLDMLKDSAPEIEEVAVERVAAEPPDGPSAPTARGA
jgi:Fe-S cluster biogenesis protein NfuA